MASTIKWTTPSTAETILSLTSAVASSAYVGVSSAITNATGLYQYAALEFNSSLTNAAAGGFVSVWLYPTLDLTNYADSTGKSLQTASLMATIALDVTAASAQRVVLTNIPIPPFDFKMNMYNGTGSSMSSGTTLTMVRYYEQVV
jgi:hypothetical protein